MLFRLQEPKGCKQFMPETAKEKGLEVREQVDERYHLEKVNSSGM